jgi:hypothetical protein
MSINTLHKGDDDDEKNNNNNNNNSFVRTVSKECLISEILSLLRICKYPT